MPALRHKSYRILVVDDEPEILEILSETLLSNGLICDTASNGKDALDRLRTGRYDLLITDVRLPDITGLDILKHVTAKYPLMPVILITGYASIENTKQALRLGAVDYIPKPFSTRVVLSAVEKSLKASIYQVSGGKSYQILYRSSVMEGIIDLVGKVGKTDSTVLITGESGTGKELVARALHQMSYRSAQQFVGVNSGGIPEGLLESELFGHKKGSYTGAISTTLGRFQMADGGTLFLDEVGNMSPAMQVKLLRVLQDGEFTSVGGTEPQQVNVRLVTATNRNLARAVETGDFREDLYYRLNVIDIHLPPLRERREDILLLAEHCLERFSGRHQSEVYSLSSEASAILLAYNWPGNVRELENTIERATVLCNGYEITPEDFSSRITGSASMPSEGNDASGQIDLPLLVENMVRHHITEALEKSGGVRTRTAAMLGLKRTTLLAKIKKLEIPDGTGKRN
jgi:DNA-binding NtrC family response regulator